MPPELFEKIYLAPKNEVKGELRNTFGNPTPLWVLFFCSQERFDRLIWILCIGHLQDSSLVWPRLRVILWDGAGQAVVEPRRLVSESIAQWAYSLMLIHMISGVYFFIGGCLMLLGSIGEWIIGNTFPFVVFGTFGGPSPKKYCIAKTKMAIRRFLVCLWRHPSSIVQRLWGLCLSFGPNFYGNGEFRKPAWTSIPCLQFKLRILPSVHGLVNPLKDSGHELRQL